MDKSENTIKSLKSENCIKSESCEVLRFENEIDVLKVDVLKVDVLEIELDVKWKCDSDID